MVPAKLAWIGLGNMGRGMCKNIIQKSPYLPPLLVYNRTINRAHEFVDSLNSNGCQVASTVAEAVQSADLIFTCLSDDAAVENIALASTESGPIAGKLFVDCSTIHPDTARKARDMFGAHGASFVACPVFGPPSFADSGQLICVLAGTQENIQRVKPYTTGVMGRANIEFIGEDVGQASKMKLLGVGVDPLIQWLELMLPGVLPAYAMRMKSGEYHRKKDPLFAASLARKDARHVLDIAQSVEVSMKSVELAEHYLREVEEYTMGGDITAMYGAIRREAGLPYENN
ncbi:Dehydrogenase multihelical [Penicillium expansum]|nr:Dehydrogenase multihelical [Penicillium expansum]